MPLLRFTIAGQMARRGLTLKTLQHTGDITDIFFAVSLTSPNRAEIAQQTGRICKAMKPERGRQQLPAACSGVLNQDNTANHMCEPTSL